MGWGTSWDEMLLRIYLPFYVGDERNDVAVVAVLDIKQVI
jgi:hypothetical protein